MRSIQSCEFAMSISALACSIAKGKSADEIALTSAILSQLADTLETIAAHQELCCPKEETTDDKKTAKPR